MIGIVAFSIEGMLLPEFFQYKDWRKSVPGHKAAGGGVRPSERCWGGEGWYRVDVTLAGRGSSVSPGGTLNLPLPVEPR